MPSSSPLSLPLSLSAAAALALLLAAPRAAEAFPAYVPLCPNANGVPGVAAIGHVAPAGGGVNNKFGIAFANNSHLWNLTLACQDSDGDGWPNGWELGDPCGNWTGGAAAPTWTTDISLPGLKLSVPKTRTLPLDWTICGKNPCPASADAADAAAPRLRGSS